MRHSISSHYHLDNLDEFQSFLTLTETVEYFSFNGVSLTPKIWHDNDTDSNYFVFQFDHIGEENTISVFFPDVEKVLTIYLDIAAALAMMVDHYPNVAIQQFCYCDA